MLYQGNYFVVSVKLNFCQRQTQCIDDEGKFQFVTDTENEFTGFQTPRKKLQSVSISPASFHAFIITLKSNILEAYKVKVDCLKDSQPNSSNKNYMKEKLNDLLVLQEKLSKYSEQIQILTLVPDKWFRTYCSQKQPPEVFYIKRYSQKFDKMHRKTPVPESLF